MRSGASTLSPSELELLVRIDGDLTIRQIKAGMPAMTGETFASTFQRLLDRRLLTVAEVDPFSEQFKSQMNRLTLFGVEAEAEVVAEFRKPPIPDLILLGVMLPDADGFDILLRLRQHPALKNVPVIMLTGKSTREDVIKGLASGADGYVTKPFEADALMRAVRTVVGLPEEPAASGNSKDPWVNKDAKP